MILGAQVRNKKKTRRIRRQKSQMIASCVTHTKGGPQTRPNRPTKPRHRPSDIRIHQKVYQRRTVARGGNKGSADPTCQPFRLSFGGKPHPILPKAVLHVSMFRDGGNRPQELYKGPPTTLTTHTHHLKASLSTLSCNLYSLG